MATHHLKKGVLVKGFHFKLLFSAVLFVASLGAAPQAQDIAPMVMVPDHPGGVSVNGCFRSNETLFGPYRVTFCFDRRGSFQVRGGGTRCDGRMDWHTSGRDIFMDLQRTSCGRRQAWEAASVDCRPLGFLGNIGRVIVGDTPRIRALRCTYHPTVPGVSRRNFTATRI
ncbi:MAG: hypothetical protein ACO1O4_02250 [Devosia sp.]